MKKSKLVLRFGIHSDSKISDLEYQYLLSVLPIPNKSYLKGVQRTLNNGKKMPFLTVENLFEYEYYFDVDNLIDVNNFFLEFWLPQSVILANFKKKYLFEFTLSYEFTIFNFEYPEILFSNDFLKKLNDLNIDLNLFFYND